MLCIGSDSWVLQRFKLSGFTLLASQYLVIAFLWVGFLSCTLRELGVPCSRTHRIGLVDLKSGGYLKAGTIRSLKILMPFGMIPCRESCSRKILKTGKNTYNNTGKPEILIFVDFKASESEKTTIFFLHIST